MEIVCVYCGDQLNECYKCDYLDDCVRCGTKRVNLTHLTHALHAKNPTRNILTNA
jgi:hypothetical protein